MSIPLRRHSTLQRPNASWTYPHLGVCAQADEHPPLPYLGSPRKPVARQSGVIIEDYSDLLEDTAHTYGRDWAIIRRYAIALDDGSLIFRDTNPIDPDPAPSSPNVR